MAHIRKLRSGRWQARYRDAAGREHARNFDRKIDAEKHLAGVEADKLRGRWVDPRLEKTRFGDWVTEYLATRVQLSARTRKRDEASLRNHVLPTFADVPIGAIQPSLIRRWVADLSERRAPATVRKAYQLLASALDAAVDAGLLTRSPCRGIDLPRIRRQEMTILDSGEVASLAAAVDRRYRATVLTAAYTGLRFGELTGLRRRHLDVGRRVLRVEETLKEVGGEFHFGEPKSRASRRSVALPGFLAGELGEHLVRFPDPDGLVFSAPQGGPIRRDNFRRRAWLPAVDASVGQPCRFHDLRHTHAALLIREGVHAKVIQERLGHASITTTLDTYGHLFEGLDSAAAQALDRLYGRIPADSSRTLDRSQVIPFGPR